MKRRPVVTIVIRTLLKYRVPFLEALQERLRTQGYELRLVHGPPSPEEQLKQDAGYLPWAKRVRHVVLPVGGRELYWQPCLQQIWGSDLVIVEQASRFLLNYLLLATQHFGGPAVAFWGHGQNFLRSAASPLGEFIKRRVSRYPHWWFAYTEGSATTVRALGYPSERITVVQNALDTVSLRAALLRLSTEVRSKLLAELGLRGTNVAIFLGGLYPAKRLDFLIDAARRIREGLPDFELLVIGAGPEEAMVRRAAQAATWIHHVGPQFDEAKVPFVALGKVLLLPAVAGLTVVDSFALEVPIVTLAGDHHPPEFEYLRDGVNAVIVPSGSDAAAYADAVMKLLRSDSYRARLRAGCRAAAETYTLAAMVERFSDGVLEAVKAKEVKAARK